MLTLVIPSASNLDESNIKHAKVFNMIVKIYLNGEFIEVPLIIIIFLVATKIMFFVVQFLFLIHFL